MKFFRVGAYLWGGILHFAHRIFTPLMLAVIAYALLLVSMNAMTPWVRDYRGNINQYLNAHLQQKLHFRDIETSWYGVYPVIKLIDLQIEVPGQQPWGCHELWLGLDLLRSLLYWHLHPGLVYLDGLSLNLIEDEQGQWSLKEKQYFPQLKAGQAPQSEIGRLILNAMAYLPEKISLKNIDARILPQHGHELNLHDLSLSGQKKTGQYYWSAELDFAKDSRIIAKAKIPLLSNLDFPRKGRFYLMTKNFHWRDFPGYQAWTKRLGLDRMQAQVDLEAWVDWQEAALSAIQFQFQVNHLKLWPRQIKTPVLVDALSANAMWQKTVSGWELAMDQINAAALNLKDNQALFYYQGDWDNYHVYLKNLPFTLLRQAKPWMPASFTTQTWMNLVGELEHLQINVKDGAMDYFLVQFQDLSLPVSASFPGFHGLRGVATWEPSGLNLALAAEHFGLDFKQQASLQFDQFYGTLTTLGKERLEIERLVLSRPDLALTLNGVIDAPLNPKARNLRLETKWSLQNGEGLLPYLSILLPDSDLRHWLQYDIKRIAKASGDVILNGFSRDFPFDHDEGEFSANAYLYDVDLKFANQWPEVKHVHGRLSAHHRVLDLVVDQGELGPGLQVKELSLIAPDLGLHHEKLLIHGQVSAAVNDMWQYLAQTPLAAKAKSWRIFNLQGPANLDLRLDIPLDKPEHNTLTLGHLNFPAQEMQLDLFLQPLILKRVQGFLDFDTQGVVNGNFSGLLGQDKIAFAWQQSDGLHRDFELRGGVDLALLKSALNLEGADFIQGHLPFHARLQFPRQVDQDLLMSWDSNLKGVSLDVAQPWGKTLDEEKPLHLDLSLKDNQSLNMVMNYQQTPWYFNRNGHRWVIATHQAGLDGELNYDTLSQKLEVKLKTLDLDWKMNQTQDFAKTPWKIKDLPEIKLGIEDLKWQGIELGQLKLTTTKTRRQWLVNELSISNPFYTFLLHGDLAWVNGAYQTKIDADMHFNRLSKALQSWGITPVAECKDGDLSFSGAWQHASLNQLKLKNLVGDLEVNLKRGNISHLDRETEQKIGLGKLLSILSLQTLPRRLQLDFSDLANQGFTFDIFRGSFRLLDGMLTTDNAMMDGPIAHIKITGGLNVVESWYDLELQVYPYITASLPVVATIAGGPLAGVATWAANHVLNQGMQKISGYTYKMTGPWMQPVVQQVKLYHQKDEKMKEKDE